MKLNLELALSNQAKLYVEASSITELDTVREYLSGNGIDSGLPDKGAKADTKKADTKADAADKPADKPTGKNAGKTAKTESKKAEGPTLEDVTAVLTKVADTFSVQEALAMNKRFGVKKAGELKPEQYADYIRFAQHCLDDDAKPSDAHPDFDNSPDGEDDVSSLV